MITSRGMGRAYWQMDGGYMPAAAPERMIQSVQARRMSEVTGGAVRNYRGAGLRGVRGVGDTTDLSFPQYTFDQPYVPPPAPAGPSMGQQWMDVLKSSLPGGMLVLQEAVARPGQTIRTPTTLITGPGTNLISDAAGSLGTGVWIVGGLAVLGLAVFAMSSHRR